MTKPKKTVRRVSRHGKEEEVEELVLDEPEEAPEALIPDPPEPRAVLTLEEGVQHIRALLKLTERSTMASGDLTRDDAFRFIHAYDRK